MLRQTRPVITTVTSATPQNKVQYNTPKKKRVVYEIALRFSDSSNGTIVSIVDGLLGEERHGEWQLHRRHSVATRETKETSSSSSMEIIVVDEDVIPRVSEYKVTSVSDEAPWCASLSDDLALPCTCRDSRCV